MLGVKEECKYMAIRTPKLKRIGIGAAGSFVVTLALLGMQMSYFLRFEQERQSVQAEDGDESR